MKTLYDELVEELLHRTRGTDCWRWAGGKDLKGYGQLRRNGVNSRLHRVAWTFARGPIPDGLCVCHKCDVRDCYNPTHLFLGTNADNMADRDRKGRARGGSLPRTHCRRGHVFTKDSTIIRPDMRRGGALARRCRVCENEYQRIRFANRTKHV